MVVFEKEYLPKMNVMLYSRKFCSLSALH